MPTSRVPAGNKIPAAEPFADGNFLVFWLARVFGTIAFQATAVAVGWQIFSLTGSAFALGMIGLAQYAPMVVLVLLVGHVADKYDRRRTVQICQGIEAVAVASLFFATFTHHLTPVMIFCVVAILGATRAFETPTAAALVPHVVPADLLPIATARWSAANQTAVVIGPAIGGLLFGVNPWAPFAFGACSWILALVLTSALKVTPVREGGNVGRRQALFGGIQYVIKHRVLLGVMSLDLFAVLLGGVTALLPVFAHNVFMAGPWALGLLRSAPAIGALITTFIIGRRAADSFPGWTLYVAVAAYGAATIVFGLSHWLIISLLALAALGAADVVSVVIRLSLVQLRTPDAMRGRVNAVNWLFIGTSNQLGEFESGVTAAWFGAVPAVLIGGIGTIAVTAIWWKLFPELRSVDAVSDAIVEGDEENDEL